MMMLSRNRRHRRRRRQDARNGVQATFVNQAMLRSMRQAIVFMLQALTTPPPLPTKSLVCRQMAFLAQCGMFPQTRVGNKRFRGIHFLTGTQGRRETIRSHLLYLRSSTTGKYHNTPRRMGSATVALRIGALANTIAVSGNGLSYPLDPAACTAMLNIVTQLITAHTARTAFL